MLHSYHRKPKQDTQGIVLDDRFRELDTVNSKLYQHPDTHRINEKPVPLMVNKENYMQEVNKHRPATGKNRTGFGGLLPRHEITHE